VHNLSISLDARSTLSHRLSRDTRRLDGFAGVVLSRCCLFRSYGIIGDRGVIVTRQ
jgi:hypothetical protein